MKTSHYTTPRTLADCEFTVGYPIADQRVHRIQSGTFMFWLACAFALLPILTVWIANGF